MSHFPPVTVCGTLEADGTVRLDSLPSIPPGRMRITFAQLPQATEPRSAWLEDLQKFWKEREALGIKPRTKEEIDADIDMLRDELEEHIEVIERLQEETSKSREQSQC